MKSGLYRPKNHQSISFSLFFTHFRSEEEENKCLAVGATVVVGSLKTDIVIYFHPSSHETGFGVLCKVMMCLNYERYPERTWIHSAQAFLSGQKKCV